MHRWAQKDPKGVTGIKLGFDPKSLKVRNAKLAQGTESSDLSLISEFFPTPWAILEISVNLKRNFFRGWGYGDWGKMTQKALECTACGPRIQKFSGRGPPDPLQETIPFTVPLTFRVHLPSRLALRTFQTFLPKPILTPVADVCTCLINEPQMKHLSRKVSQNFFGFCGC